MGKWLWVYQYRCVGSIGSVYVCMYVCMYLPTPLPPWAAETVLSPWLAAFTRFMMKNKCIYRPLCTMAQLAGAAEYTDVISPNKCSGYDTKQSNGEAPVMLELWGMRINPLLPPLGGPHLPGVVVPDRVLSMGRIKLNRILMLSWIVWNRTVFTFNCT